MQLSYRPLASLSILLLIAIVCAACASSTPPVAAPTPLDNGQMGWFANALGSPPDVSIAVKPTTIQRDQYWGPLWNRIFAHPDGKGDFISHVSGAITLNAQQVDLHVVYRDPIGLQDKNKKFDGRQLGYIGVIWNAAPFDPLTIRDGGGRPLFSPPMPLPSGVIAYLPNPSYGQEYGSMAPSAYMLPSRAAYIVCDQGSAPRVHSMLAANPTPPPGLAMPADSLAGLTFGVSSLRFVDAKVTDQASITQGMTAAGFGVRGGAGGSVEGYATYATSDDAERGYTALQRECAQKPKSCLMTDGLFRDGTASRQGNKIFVSLAFTQKLLTSLQTATF